MVLTIISQSIFSQFQFQLSISQSVWPAGSEHGVDKEDMDAGEG